MGSTTSQLIVASDKLSQNNCFIIDRLICANFNNIEGNNINIGIFNLKNDYTNTNPLKNQGIRIGSNSPILQLKNFIQTDQNLIYEFEDDVKLSVFKKNETDVYFNIKTPILNVTNAMDPTVRKFYKNIGMHETYELDMLEKIIYLK
jgi:hypothetical protein